MNDQMWVHQLRMSRRRSMSMLPVALILVSILGGVVLLEGLHLSDVGFLPGVLVGALGYWVVLELMTIVRIGRLLRQPPPRGLGRGLWGEQT